MTVNDLEAEVVAIILGFLPWQQILHARVNRTWKEAARLSVPPFAGPITTETGFATRLNECLVCSRDKAVALKCLSKALPNLPFLNFDVNRLGSSDLQVQDGPDPDPHPLVTGSKRRSTPIDIQQSISGFTGIRRLRLINLQLNGRYPFLFEFRHLEHLEMRRTPNIKWELAMLANMPQLKTIRLSSNFRLTGSLQDLRANRSTLVEVTICECEDVVGSIHDLADFPKLERLDIASSDERITGDVHELNTNDFPAMKDFFLHCPGFKGYRDVDRIVDAEPLVLSLYHLRKRRPVFFLSAHNWKLSPTSPDRVDGHYDVRSYPSSFDFVEAGPRLGWRWTNDYNGGSCEPIWLDPEPSRDDPNYEQYVKEKNNIDKQVYLYRGYSAPPTAQQHAELLASISHASVMEWINTHHGGRILRGMR